MKAVQTFPVLLLFLQYSSGSLGILVDVKNTEAQDMERFGSSLKLTLEMWYPIIATLLDTPTFNPIDHIQVEFVESNKSIITSTQVSGKTIIRGNAEYFRKNPNDIEGHFIEEITLLILQYQECNSDSACPCKEMISKGMRKWVRYFIYEPERRPELPEPGFCDMYSKSDTFFAFLLNFMHEKGLKLFSTLNESCRNGHFNDDEAAWQATESKLSYLWEELVAPDANKVECGLNQRERKDFVKRKLNLIKRYQKCFAEE